MSTGYWTESNVRSFEAFLCPHDLFINNYTQYLIIKLYLYLYYRYNKNVSTELIKK
jgi:hypothetical protein